MEKRYYYTVQAESAEKYSGAGFIIIAAVLSTLCMFMLFKGLNFYFNVQGFRIFLPIFIATALFCLGAYFLRKIRYRGSYVPPAAMMLLIGIGLVIQVRMHVRSVDPGYSAQFTSAAGGETGIVQENTLREMTIMDGALDTQITAYVLGIIVVIAAVKFFSMNRLKWIGQKYALVFAVAVTALTLMVAMSKSIDGGKFLFSRTPWEPVKIVLPLSMAGFFYGSGRLFRLYSGGRFHFSLVNWGPFLLMCTLPILLFMILGDFGQVLIYSGIILFLLFIASESLLYPLFGIVFIVVSIYGISLFMPLLPDYIAVRFELWQHFWAGFPSPEWWDRSYQTANAIFAVQAGGLTGSGLGLGHPELVPLAVSDFIYAEIAEEIGFIGSLAIILLYLSIIISGIHTAAHCSRRFDYLATSVLSLLLGLQVFINLGGVINFIPLTGIVLPFLSKGGFSIITFSVIVGIIMAVSHNNAVEHASVLSEEQYAE